MKRVLVPLVFGLAIGWAATSGAANDGGTHVRRAATSPVASASTASAGVVTVTRQGETVEIGPDSTYRTPDGTVISVPKSAPANLPPTGGIRIVDQDDGTSTVVDEQGRLITTMQTGAGFVVANPVPGEGSSDPQPSGALWSVRRDQVGLGRVVLTPIQPTPVLSGRTVSCSRSRTFGSSDSSGRVRGALA